MIARFRNGSTFLVLLLSAVALTRWFSLTSGAPSAALDRPAANESNIVRLKQMFLESSLDAINRNYPRQGHNPALNQSVGDSGQDSSDKDSDARRDVKAKFIAYTNEPARGGIQKSDAIVGKNNLTNSDDASDDDKLSKLIHKDVNDNHNHARQSSLFPGLVSPALGNSFGLGGGNTNPLMNGALLRPPSVFGNMPSLQSFHLPAFPNNQQQQQFAPFRPPKTSVIGNGGGAMALTNDNVVVVNVLSGNY